MRKNYVIRIEILNASDAERKLIQKHMKRNGFKKISKNGALWQLSKTIKDYTDLPELYSYIKSVIEKIDHSNLRVTTELEMP